MQSRSIPLSTKGLLPVYLVTRTRELIRGEEDASQIAVTMCLQSLSLTVMRAYLKLLDPATSDDQDSFDTHGLARQDGQKEERKSFSLWSLCLFASNKG